MRKHFTFDGVTYIRKPATLLPERDNEIVRLHKEGLSLAQIVEKVGLSRERIRQIVIRETRISQWEAEGIVCLDAEKFDEEQGQYTARINKKIIDLYNKGIFIRKIVDELGLDNVADATRVLREHKIIKSSTEAWYFNNVFPQELARLNTRFQELRNEGKTIAQISELVTELPPDTVRHLLYKLRAKKQPPRQVLDVLQTR